MTNGDLGRPGAASWPKSNCKSCGGPIIWATTTSDRSMPVDATPVPDGTLRLTDRPSTSPLVEVVGESLHEPRYRSHFSTCPYSSKHRKRRTA